ncbi:MAG: DUF4364 family protein [Oscillospiraceae bacterium]
MEGIGFIHEKLDIKILILYILNHLPAAVDAQTLSDLVFCDNGIGYFDYSDCLAELVDTRTSRKRAKYRITERAAATSMRGRQQPAVFRAHEGRPCHGADRRADAPRCHDRRAAYKHTGGRVQCALCALGRH